MSNNKYNDKSNDKFTVNLYQSLSHSKWNCKYHVVFIPKRRQKVLFGQRRTELGKIFHALAKQKECNIVEGNMGNDHVHICMEIPPKHAVSSIIGFMKGKSAIAMARMYQGKQKNFTGASFWGKRLCCFNSWL